MVRFCGVQKNLVVFSSSVVRVLVGVSCVVVVVVAFGNGISGW